VPRGGDPSAGDRAGSPDPGQQDVSGQMHRRNRYYDPMTGQFTAARTPAVRTILLHAVE